MKSKKLKLNDLKIQSFVTSLGNEEKNTIKAGDVSVIGELTANPAVCHPSEEDRTRIADSLALIPDNSGVVNAMKRGIVKFFNE